MKWNQNKPWKYVHTKPGTKCLSTCQKCCYFCLDQKYSTWLQGIEYWSKFEISTTATTEPKNQLKANPTHSLCNWTQLFIFQRTQQCTNKLSTVNIDEVKIQRLFCWKVTRNRWCSWTQLFIFRRTWQCTNKLSTLNIYEVKIQRSYCWKVIRDRWCSWTL